MCTQEGALASISPLPISKASFGGSIGVLADWGICLWNHGPRTCPSISGTSLLPAAWFSATVAQG